MPFFGYKLFFLYAEPVLTAVTSINTLTATMPVSATVDELERKGTQGQSPDAIVTVYQVVNLSLLAMAMQHFLLKGSNDRRMWRTVSWCMLVHDTGRLLSTYPSGLGFWKIQSWDTITWMTIGLSCIGIAIRTTFLMDYKRSEIKIKSTNATVVKIPSIYRLMFAYVEPAMALGYSTKLFIPHAQGILSSNGSKFLFPELLVASFQQANLYLLLATLTYSVLHLYPLGSPKSVKTWKTYTLIYFLADIGHIASFQPLGDGFSVFWKVGSWDLMLWMFLGGTYFIMAVRLAFLSRIGLNDKKKD